MRRAATTKTRGANRMEKSFQRWLKYQPCGFCGSQSGSIVDHCKGSTYRSEKILIGHWFCNSKCIVCDTYTTLGSHTRLELKTGKTDSDVALAQMSQYESETGATVPSCVKEEIRKTYLVNNNITDWEAIL